MGAWESIDDEPHPAKQPSAVPTKKSVPRENLVQTKLSGVEIRRGAGDIGGNEFMVDELTNCKVIITDVCDSMMIDRCVNCELILSAVRGSIFVRDSENSRFQMVCGQFRCRGCTNCDFFMHAKTGPVVESSKDLRIGCGTLYYPALAEQMREVGLDPAVNPWSDVHDFTPGDGHFTCQSGTMCELPMMDRSGFLLPFTRTTDAGFQTFRFRIMESEIDKLAQLSTFGDVRLTGVSREGGRLLCTFQGQAREDVEARIRSLQPVPC
jgi:protein XRP2